MATKQKDTVGLYFQDLFENLNIEVVAPLMRAAGLLSVESEVELLNKGTRKQQVRFIIKEVKQHFSGENLFKNCLKKSEDLEGHQKLLLRLYTESQSALCAGMKHKKLNSCLLS